MIDHTLQGSFPADPPEHHNLPESAPTFPELNEQHLHSTLPHLYPLPDPFLNPPAVHLPKKRSVPKPPVPPYLPAGSNTRCRPTPNPTTTAAKFLFSSSSELLPFPIKFPIQSSMYHYYAIDVPACLKIHFCNLQTRSNQIIEKKKSPQKFLLVLQSIPFTFNYHHYILSLHLQRQSRPYHTPENQTIPKPKNNFLSPSAIPLCYHRPNPLYRRHIRSQTTTTSQAANKIPCTVRMSESARSPYFSPAGGRGGFPGGFRPPFSFRGFSNPKIGGTIVTMIQVSEHPEAGRHPHMNLTTKIHMERRKSL